MTRSATFALSVLLVSCGRGDTLLVASGFTDEVVELRASDGQIVERVAVDPRPTETDEPHGLALAPDGRYWYASVSHGEPTLWKFERPGNRLVGRMRLETFGAGRIRITPDGQTGLIPDYYRDGGGTASHVAVVRLNDLARLATPTVCPTPHDAAMAPNGRRAAITCAGSDEIVILDPRNGSEIRRFPVDSTIADQGAPAFRPMNAVWSPSGDRIYVTLHEVSLLRVFDSVGGAIGEVQTGTAPAQLALTRDGTRIVTANRGDGTASIIATASLTEVRRLSLDVTHPHGVALDPSGRRAFISYEGDTRRLGGVVAIDLTTGRPLWRGELGSYATGVIYVPAGRR